MPKVATLGVARPLDCLFAQAVRAQYAELDWYVDRGYIHYRTPKTWAEYEHRLVARIAFGPVDGYHVHHIDGDKLNNRADNLLPVSPADHAGLRQNPDLSAVLICAQCGATFARLASRAKRAESHFCSRACADIVKRRAIRPDATALLELMNGVGNWCELGLMFGVSDNAVRKWARKYDLDLSVCDGRRAR